MNDLILFKTINIESFHSRRLRKVCQETEFRTISILFSQYLYISEISGGILFGMKSFTTLIIINKQHINIKNFFIINALFLFQIPIYKVYDFIRLIHQNEMRFFIIPIDISPGTITFQSTISTTQGSGRMVFSTANQKHLA